MNQMIKSGTSDRMREAGKKMMYAPRTPEIAPLAPSAGTCEPHENAVCAMDEPSPQIK